MKNLKKMLVATIAIVALSTMNAFAGSIGIGVSGSLAMVSATGTELEAAAEKSQTTTALNDTYIGDVFAEYIFDGDHGMTFGVAYIPGSADVNASTLSRTDTETSQEGTVTTTSASVTRSAQAEVDNHLTYYAELPLHGGLYGKIGYSTMDVTTLENIGTSKKYGNKSVDGTMYGIGYKNSFGNNGFYKLEANRTNYGGFTLNETGQSSDSNQNSITVNDIDIDKASFAIVYKF